MDDKHQALLFLNDCRFTAGEVMRAVGMSPHTLTNYLSKSEIRLCSGSAGQGRARQFCLIDVYQLALMHRLVTLTSRVAWSARALNVLLFERFDMELAGGRFGGGSPRWASEDEACLAFCQDILVAPEHYHWRETLDPYYLAASDHVLEKNTPILDYGRRQDILGSPFKGGVVWNITYELSCLDTSLFRAVEGRRRDA